MGNIYTLPKLPYGYNSLEPYISREQLQIHHEKHHQAYVSGANAIFERLDKARKEGVDLDMKAILKELSFHIGGHLLHTLFWGNLAPAAKSSPGPSGILATAIDKEFGSFERFKKEFSQAAVSVEGSGWAALSFCMLTNRPLIMQIEKHNVNVYPMFRILLVLDLWEHAYYLDYKNLRAKFVEAFWNIVNWDEVGRRFEEMLH
ncbi:MAG TPA: superoxide dismutase [Syntrophales bacterium]|jgi:Fe-Mn family superoxide dismutase|nr:superoxide dismutase [Syntrophales bacterium]HOX94528.1 superoxide dismutase [Syntrophales bacterium]HPI58190.1 superoxide dismutase [Syntrophales bacterium]HPN26028.1 superoxide dismutase [Syntrophales bacterium]HQM30319.1 superoxide dismutase [Syntrophales bacterium]